MNSALVRSGLIVLAALTLMYIGPKVFSSADTTDFKYIWLAGDLWRAGENPYSEVYVTKGKEIFAGYNTPVFWPYPPNWWPVATAFSLADYPVSGQLWRVMSALALAAGCLMLSRTVQVHVRSLPLWRHVVFWALVGTMSATAITLSLGQTSALIFLGVCLFANAWLRRSTPVMILALCLLALKPQVGLVMAGLLMPSIFWWRALCGAAILVIAMAMPSFVQDGFGEVLGSMLARLSEYDDFGVNGPLELSGIANLIYVFSGTVFPTTTSLFVGLGVNCAIGFLAAKKQDVEFSITALMAVFVTTACIVPLHFYDLLFLATLFVLSSRQSVPVQVALLAGVFVIWRANNFETVTGLTPSGTIYGAGVFVSSLAGLWLAVVLLYAAVNRKMAGGVNPGGNP